MRIQTIMPQLRRIQACKPAREWLAEMADRGYSWEAAWKVCTRGDWMLWLLGAMQFAPGTVCADVVIEIQTRGEIMFVNPIGEWVADNKRESLECLTPLSRAITDDLSGLLKFSTGANRVWIALEAYVDRIVDQSAINVPDDAAEYLLAWANLIREYFPTPPSLIALKRIDY